MHGLGVLGQLQIRCRGANGRSHTSLLSPVLSSNGWNTWFGGSRWWHCGLAQKNCSQHLMRRSAQTKKKLNSQKSNSSDAKIICLSLYHSFFGLKAKLQILKFEFCQIKLGITTDKRQLTGKFRSSWTPNQICFYNTAVSFLQTV